MKYFINLKKHGLIIKHYFTKDKEFSKIPENILMVLQDAMLFESYTDARLFAENNSFYFDGKQIEAFPMVVNLFEDPTLDIRGIREDSPQKLFFNEEDVRNAILNGDDSFHNSLVVDHDGNVKTFKRDNNYEINDFAVINGEVFQARNGYIGLEASEDKNFVNSEYLRLFEAWGNYILSYGETQSANDVYDSNVDPDEIKKEISSFVNKNV